MKVSEVNTAMIAQLEAALGQTIPVAPKAFLRVLAKVFSAIFVILYKYADFNLLQMFVSTATLSDTTVLGKKISPLKEWGRLIGAGDPYAAIPAELGLTLTVSPVSGQTLAAGTECVDINTQLVYRTTSTITLDAATKQVTVRSSVAGGIGNSLIGNQLSFINPPSTLYPIATIYSTPVMGVDSETEVSYRQRVINYFQRKPEGGAYADYYRWGMLATNIAGIYPYTGVIPGTVEVYVLSATETDGIPTQGQIDDVLAQINDATRRPAGALVLGLPIVMTDFEVTVTGLVATDLVNAQADITAAVEGYFASREPYIEGLSFGLRKDRIILASVSSVIEDVVSQYGGSFGVASITEGGDPLSAYGLDSGEFAKCTSVVFA